MSDSHVPPPEVPDEFAAAYRAAYDEAMRSSVATGHRASAERPARGRPARHENAPRTTVRAAVAVLAAARERRWLLPMVAAVVAVALVLGAYLVGRTFADDTASRAPARSAESADAPWHGEVTPVEVSQARATCTSRPGRDSGGARVTYVAANAVDGDESTAWRCRGDAAGERLVLRLPGPTELGEVGLIPGYAKTDPVSGVDRYAQNNRITKVRWTIGDRTVDQTLDGDPDDRAMQLLRIPRTAASRVTLEVVDVDRGERDTTAISEVRLAAALD